VEDGGADLSSGKGGKSLMKKVLKLTERHPKEKGEKKSLVENTGGCEKN